MPCLKIHTNLPKIRVPSDFVDKIIPILASVVKGKLPKEFTCIVSSDCSISFGGESTTPGAVATLESIGQLGVEENKVIAKGVSDFVEKELGISPHRFFLSFYDLSPQNIGISGTTVAHLWNTTK